MPDADWRVMATPHLAEPPWVRGAVLGGTGAGILLGLVAAGVAITGNAAGFDAGPACTVLAAIGGAAVILGVLLGAAWRSVEELRYQLRLREEDPIPGTPVPERPAIVERSRRALAARIEAQRRARSQSAASGGRVSSTEAGLPPHGSSDASTAP